MKLYEKQTLPVGWRWGATESLPGQKMRWVLAEDGRSVYVQVTPSSDDEIDDLDELEYRFECEIEGEEERALLDGEIGEENDEFLLDDEEN